MKRSCFWRGCCVLCFAVQDLYEKKSLSILYLALLSILRYTLAPVAGLFIGAYL